MIDSTVQGLPAFQASAIEAVGKFNMAAVKGFEQLGSFYFDSARQAFETAIESNKRIAGVKTFAELTELQANLTKEFVENLTKYNKSAAALGATVAHDVAMPVGAIAKNGAAARQGRRASGARAS